MPREGRAGEARLSADAERALMIFDERAPPLAPMADVATTQPVRSARRSGLYYQP